MKARYLQKRVLSTLIKKKILQTEAHEKSEHDL